VHLYEEYGESCVEKLRGMFAFAIWDERRKTLFLARDRVGIKPLYYWRSNNSLIFGSEIKAILADPEVRRNVAPEMIDRFLSFYYIPGEDTMLQDIYKLAPGSYMLIRNGQITVKQYWDLAFRPAACSVHDAEMRLLTLLDECVGMHMISDVPVGFLLSGGVDSTAMLGMAVGKTEHKLNSFTLGFAATGIVDERPYARLAANRYGAEHHEITIGSQEFADFLPKFAWYMEEPICEPQGVALYYITKLASEYAKVLISGEGGDEAFAGYPIYRNVLWLERIKSILGPMKEMLSKGVAQVNGIWPSHRLGKYGPMLNTAFNSYYYSRSSGPSRFFNGHGKSLYTSDFIQHVDRKFSTSPVMRYLGSKTTKGLINQMLYIDTKTSLPDDLLLKADKMTMANSVELRVPLLDHIFLEFAASLPENFKVRGFMTKYIAKRALRERIPIEILQRKKVGFPVPYESWMRNELKEWVRDILLDRESLSRGYFRRECIEYLLNRDYEYHDNSKEILSLVSLELWHRSFVDGARKAKKDADRMCISAVN
jgi:asparagine synthase (glutamine-hydrolysing)